MTLSGITPREHTLRLCNGSHKQTRWPFKAMVLGDYLIVRSKEDAKRINSALSTFYKSRNGAGRRFTVTQWRRQTLHCHAIRRPCLDLQEDRMSKSSKEGKHRRDILNTSPLRPSTRAKLEARLNEPVAPLKNQRHIVSAQQWTFIQELISNDGHITLTEAAIRAGYPKESASSIGSELTDPKKKPHVVAAIQEYRAELAEKYGTNFDRHMRDLQRIRDQALEAGNFGAAVSAEYRRGQALGTIYVDRKEIRVGTIDSMSKDEVRRKLEEIKALYGAPPQTLIDIEPDEINAEEIETVEVEETPQAKTIIEEMRDVERSRVSAIQKRKEETIRRFGSAIRKQGEPRDTGLPDSDAADILDVGAQGSEDRKEGAPESAPDSLRPEAWIDGDANLHTGAVAPEGDDQGL